MVVKKRKIELNFFTQQMEEAKGGVGVNQEKKEPTNLLDRFSPEQHPKLSQDANSESLHEPDLNLRLCLGSIDSENSKEYPLTRSSSVCGVISLRKDYGEGEKSFLSLARSCSLPTETEQEQRLITMKELQTMRRIEAKNRLVERQRMCKEAKEKEKSPATLEPMPTLSTDMTAWAASSPASSPALYRAIVNIKASGDLSENQKGMYFPLMSPTPASPCGLEGSAAPNRLSRFNSSCDSRNSEPVISSGKTSNGMLVQPAENKPENPYKRARITGANFEDNGIDVMRQMPSVTTTGDGPNGRRIEGFLYTYTRGHVSIVCVCHGSFLSPAEFVKHAGGKDVPNPMKHITVYSALSA